MFKKTLLATLLMSAFGVQSAPLVLDGDFIKIGVNDIGTLGSNGNTSPGVLYDNTGTGTFNTAYDYLTPGSPFEGWTVQYNGSTSVKNNNASWSSPQMTGTLTEYSGTVYNGTTYDNRAVWEGTSADFDLLHDVRFNDNQKYIDITSVLTAKVNMTDIYFARYTDPDARAASGDSSRTTNTLGFSPIPSTQVVFSEALVSKYALGLYSAASNVGAGISSGWSTDATTYYTGTNGGDGDYTIGLGFLVPSVSAGDIVTFQYAYIFGPSTLDAGATAVVSGAGGGTAGVVPGCVSDCDMPGVTPSTPTIVSTTTETSSSDSISRGETVTAVAFAFGTPVAVAVNTFGRERGSKVLNVEKTVTTTTTTPKEITTTYTTPVTTTTTTTSTLVETYSDDSVVRTPTVTTSTNTANEVASIIVDTRVVDVDAIATQYSTRIDQYNRLSNSNEMFNLQLNSNVVDRLSVKGSGAYLIVDDQKSNTSDTYKQRSNRLGVGYDKGVTDNLFVGIQYNNISSSLTGNNAGGSLDKNHVGIYSLYTKKDWLLVSDAGLSYNQYKTNHSLPELYAANSSSTHGYDAWLSSRVYSPSLKGFRPYAGARIERNVIKSVNESGSSLTAVGYDKIDNINTSAEYGIRYDYQIKKFNLIAEAGSNSDKIKTYKVGAMITPNEKVSGGLTFSQQEYQDIKNDIIFANLKVLF
jgi:hypothetical protein